MGKAQFNWTPELEEQLHELREKGCSDKRIATLIGHGLSEGKVRYALECFDKYGRLSKGIGNRNKNFTDEEDAQIAEAYCHEGLPIVEIAAAMGRTPGSVRTRVYRMGLVRQNKEAHRRNSHAIRSKSGRRARERGVHVIESIRSLWTARTDRARAEVYNGQRYEDANVPARIPGCGRLG